MFGFDIERVRENARQASTEDLLDRVTVYRLSLEPAALEVFLGELRQRGLTAEAILTHEQGRGAVLADPAGQTQKCTRCHKPAIATGWAWHRLFDKVPIFPRRFYWCEDHQPRPEPGDEQPARTENGEEGSA